MFKVMLVDDEKWILESLKGTVNWQELGFVIAGEAYNGIEAFDKILEIRPDVVFIDIRMPGMNGIQLIKRLHDAGLPVQCIVASGYAEFEYAKQAMQYGAVGYCLKPFDQEEIIEILMSVKGKIAQSQQLLQHTLLNAIYSEDGDPSTSEASVRHFFERLNLWGDPDEGFLAVTIQGGSGERFFSEQHSIPIPIGRGKFAYLLRGHVSADVHERLANHLSPQTKGIGISPVFMDIGRIREHIDAANIASYCYFTARVKISKEAGSNPPDELERFAMQFLDQGMKEQDARIIRQGFDLLETRFREGRYDIRHAFRLYNLVLSFVYHAGIWRSDYEERYMYDYDELVSVYGNVTNMLEYLNHVVMEGLKSPAGDTAELSGDEILPQIVQYVNGNFREHLSIQNISKRFFMHPNYLSFLFKKEMQVNFTKYLTDIRMDHACKLLRSTALSVGEIAEQSGYGDYFYFAKIFKKHTGVTPTEYRLPGKV
ncbi:response regulator transcription factor [Paenibacillus nasutitermitis]|uniref:DNA-binding response regulator n=1 Tax=Paenibacillus nasutitermitis TaxID=1652958 RepID=A0A917E403_9BACL|nr:response regulator [Paenibacillus nasutitermitis]GGE02658.1 hypothetical protein GCM10010911_72130 [Paenibacillus nasutitermitis]